MDPRVTPMCLQGDTALHWAGRRRHGSVLLQIALEVERIRPGSSTAMWFAKVLDCVWR